MELCLNNNFDFIEKNNEKIKNNYKYNLFCIILNEGHPNNSHYWTILKDNKKTWKCFYDKLVWDIDNVKKNLLFGLDNDNSFIYENIWNANLLFYVKKNDFNHEKFVNINSVICAKIYFVNKNTEIIFKK